MASDRAHIGGDPFEPGTTRFFFTSVSLHFMTYADTLLGLPDDAVPTPPTHLLTELGDSLRNWNVFEPDLDCI